MYISNLRQHEKCSLFIAERFMFFWCSGSTGPVIDEISNDRHLVCCNWRWQLVREHHISHQPFLCAGRTRSTYI